MDFNSSERHLQADPASRDLVAFFQENAKELGLSRSQLYYDFPIYKDLDEMMITSKILLLSPEHGVVAIGTSNTTHEEEAVDSIYEADRNLSSVFSALYSRLIRNANLRKSKTELRFPANAVVYAPFVGTLTVPDGLDSQLLFTDKQFTDYLNSVQVAPMPAEVYGELISTVEGAKGIIRPKPRNTENTATQSKGRLASQLESEIASFDRCQKQGAIAVLDGIQRIRGLAGSGKTIVLAMKAAQMHLRFPDASILYTYYTRSLHQYIQRLITRFYRQFDDKDPDWTRLNIMHAWGGRNVEGVYYNACLQHGVSPLSYGDASRVTGADPFEYACQALLSAANIRPMFDYVFVDEGQDFPNSFLTLCVKLAERSRLVFAYDELQTIFQTKVPDPVEFAGQGVEITDDVVLYKCYRNPREILVVAHALGFGLYGSHIVQMLENQEHWEDIGYRVVEGQFVEGSQVVIERPAENSLPGISRAQRPHDLVQAMSFDGYWDEIATVVAGIRSDIKEGLRPDDILVVVVDDRNAKNYLGAIAEGLAEIGIQSNNIHADAFGVREFQRQDCVTLSTVHKAKGNEAFMVYVVGVDALFSSYASVRERNMLFTAMTRAKGWVRVSGIGEWAAVCKNEIDQALAHFPYLVFNYPSPAELKVMKRNLAEKAVRKQKAERLLEQALDEMSPDEVKSFIAQRSIKKGDR